MGDLSNGDTPISSSNFTRVYKATYEVPGAPYTSAAAPDAEFDATSVTAPAVPAAETGYQFLGWYDATNSKVYKPGATVTLGGSDVTLTAVYGSTVRALPTVWPPRSLSLTSLLTSAPRLPS